jgi:DNA polymerase-3 subunit delta'
VGQERAIAVLRRIAASGKVAQAYLFTGVEGCGRRKTALAFVEALYCGREEGCGVCASCRKLAAGNHPDLHLVQPDGPFIKIDQIRELQRELAYRPFEATRKTCIIDGADRLNQAAGNALLKTLEEPPGEAVLVLLATSVDLVLPTIRSRCQELVFRGVGEEAIAHHLIGTGIDADTAQVAAALADGSIGRALAVSSSNVLAARRDFLGRLATLTTREIGPLFALAEEASSDRETAIQHLELLLSLLHDQFQLATGGTAVANRDLLPQLASAASRRSPERQMALIGQVMTAREAVQRNANPRLTLDALFINLADS